MLLSWSRFNIDHTWCILQERKLLCHGHHA
jgi:hypothetical protein